MDKKWIGFFKGDQIVAAQRMLDVVSQDRFSRDWDGCKGLGFFQKIGSCYGWFLIGWMPAFFWIGFSSDSDSLVFQIIRFPFLVRWLHILVTYISTYRKEQRNREKEVFLIYSYMIDFQSLAAFVLDDAQVQGRHLDDYAMV
jgi:hypothetical protein